MFLSHQCFSLSLSPFLSKMNKNFFPPKEYNWKSKFSKVDNELHFAEGLI